MAFPLQRGLAPPEIEFLSEMETITVVPRQRLEELELLSVRERIGPRSRPHPPGLRG
jgi:GINS complex subunit 2